MAKWSNVSGDPLCIEMIPADDKRDDVTMEMVVEWESTGYYDPGVCSGPPEKCYPPEGEDERTVTGAYIHVWLCDEGPSAEAPQFKIPVPEEHLEKLQDFFQEEIDELDVPDPGDDGPDHPDI